MGRWLAEKSVRVEWYWMKHDKLYDCRIITLATVPFLACVGRFHLWSEWHFESYIICYIYICTQILSHVFFQFAPPNLCFSNFNHEEISPSKSLLWAQVKHAAEPGGTPCLGDTHESETCNEEAWGRREVGHRDAYIFLWKGKVLSREFFLAIIYIYIGRHNYFNWVT